MVIETRDFGQMELNEEAVIDFVSPIYGFEDFRRYVLLSDDEVGAGLIWMQAVDEKDVCFILLDTEEVGINYIPELPGDIVELLELDEGQHPIVRVIAVVPEDFKKTRVNLKSPIIINPNNRKAAQVILEAEYPIRMQLFEQEAG